MIFQPILLSIFVGSSLALADPLTTPAARLAPRADDPELVGYISGTAGFSDVRSCDFPQTVSTSGSFVQCCPTAGACQFYTSCNGNTLVGAATEVPCDFDAALTCNTGIVLPTTGAANGGSYLACWQRTLGSSAFTFVQNIGTATAIAPTVTSSTSPSGNTSSSTSRNTSSSPSNAILSISTTTTSTSSGQAAPTEIALLNGGVVGAVALLAQVLL